MANVMEQGHGAGHTEPNYMAVFVALSVLTVAEIGVAVMPGFPRWAVGTMLVILAFGKAALVALYFMHLKFEKKTLTIIAATPILLCVMLMIMLLPDSDPSKLKHPPAPAAATQPAHAP
jgi:caa(3)-type oxidase subunit IV